MLRMPHGRIGLNDKPAGFCNPSIRILLFVFALILPFVGFLFPSPLCALENDECLACHETFDQKKFSGSIHGSNLCTSCHTDIQELPHPEKLAKVDCAGCHHLEAKIYNASDHGKALKRGSAAAGCVDCHGNAHEMLDYRNPASTVYRLNIPKTCAVCHENQKQMERYALSEPWPVSSYAQTVHGKALAKGEMSTATCTDCHGSHDLHAPTNPDSKIYRLNIPATCGKCHENVKNTYNQSIHAKAVFSGKREAPVCTDCHGEHTIKSRVDPKSSVYTTSVSEKTCGHCHEAEKIITKYRLPSDRLKTYLESYHGLASRFGVTTVANCASCHEAHGILPAGDPDSSVNKKNLPQTCGRCHSNVSEQLAKGSVHLAPSPFRDRAVYFTTIFYLGLILVVIGGMLLHNFLDFSSKLKEHYRQKKQAGNYVRFNLNERIQHLLLFISFTVLAYTGFALRNRDAWWALPISIFNTDWDWRGVIHRAAAVIFTSLCVYHALYLIFAKRGRDQWKALLPVSKDVLDFVGMIKHYLGRQSQKPKFGRYSYIEKAEYWALIWGTLIMVVTGALLTFADFAMHYIPKWVFDVATTIHFYEAVLATLAIFIWHFYFVIFDPEHYPMNWSMTSGLDHHPQEPSQKPPQTDQKK